MSSSTITDKDLIAFRAISSFIDELGSLFENKHHALKLYKRLISKTTLNHESAIIKHIETFKAFCIENRDPIKNRQRTKLEGRIEYSARVFVDLKVILSDDENDTETTEAIWNHMLAISAIIDPENKTKEILKKRMRKPQNKSANIVSTPPMHGAGNAFGLIQNLMGSIQSEIGQSGALNESGGDPMKLITNIMSSGVFTKLLGQVSSGLKDQNVDISELMGATQTMFSSMKANDPENKMPDIQNIISNVMTNLPPSEEVIQTPMSTPVSTPVAITEQPPLSTIEPLPEDVEFHVEEK